MRTAVLSDRNQQRDQVFMAKAIAEARRGVGRTHPNPAVGAVVVRGNTIEATGFHTRAGAPHAEVVALARAGARARGSTMYVTLEPCDHLGRTPPCTDAIVAAGVRRVVYASSDPNPLVNGKGVARLRSLGIEVVGHVLRKEADQLNQPFFTSMRTGLPWVMLKAAVTLDGKLASQTGDSKWITSPAARRRAHLWRDRVDALLVGAGTVRRDDPQLTTRLSRRAGRTPVRVILDGRLSINPRAKVFRVGPGLRTVVATVRAENHPTAVALRRRGVEVWKVPGARGRIALRPLLRRLAREGLLEVMVEGGAKVHASFLRSGLVNQVALFLAPRLLGAEGLTWSGELGLNRVRSAPRFEVTSVERLGEDLLLLARPRD